MKLENKIAVITGASGGIGRETALAFAAAGAMVVLHANRHPERAISTLREIEQRGGQGAFLSADFAFSARQDDFIEGVLSMFPKIDILVNAAGVDLMSPSMRKMSFEDRLNAAFTVDVLAAVRLSKRIGQRMLETHKSTQGSIIFLAWDRVDRGMEGDTAELYAISKGAISGFASSLAQSLAPGVRVNTISPGWIRTHWGENAPESFKKRGEYESLAERWGTPEEVAALALFLASEDASYLNGLNINVNGGFNYRQNPMNGF